MSGPPKEHQWKPGQSGNPGGRPKGLERTVREAMATREYTSKEGVAYKGLEAAFQCLLDLAFDDDQPGRERIAAFREVLDRGYGKSKQHVELTDGTPTNRGKPASEMTDEELAAGLAALRTLKKLGVTADDDGVAEH